MIEIKILLKDIIFDVEQGIDLSIVSEQDAILYLTQAYQFLPPPLGVVIEADMAIITSPGKGRKDKQSDRLLDKATKEANRGRYSQAIHLLQAYSCGLQNLQAMF